MFYVFCPFTVLNRHFRLTRVSQTIDFEEIYKLVLKVINFTACGLVLIMFVFYIDFQSTPDLLWYRPDHVVVNNTFTPKSKLVVSTGLCGSESHIFGNLTCNLAYAVP